MAISIRAVLHGRELQALERADEKQADDDARDTLNGICGDVDDRRRKAVEKALKDEVSRDHKNLGQNTTDQA